MKKTNEKKLEHSEPYLVFARKFRPQTFDDVLGQEPITTTLKNAISKSRIAQSFLFTGSRGVGKTSTARIFAKAINCEKGPSETPCNKCSICDEITQGTSLDVLEIDGASNRGIDEIRNLRENVKFKPAYGRFKVYIIDEVHMLTGEAFNALLKTLEEPPEHVKFIFATTEVHKVPVTILSRCQRFNFRRIPTEEIAKKLKEIAEEEKIKINGNAIYLIARQADGSLRDAESLLDQLASFGEGVVEESDITFSLGLTDRDIYFSLLSFLKNRDAKSLLGVVAKVIDQGKDLVQFWRGLLALFRDLLILSIGGQGEKLIEAMEEEIAELKELSNAFSRQELLFSLTLLQQLNREIRWSDTPRFLIETCLLKIADRENLKAIDDLLKELKSLKQNTVGTGLPATYSGGGGKPAPTISEIPQKKKENFEVGTPSVVPTNQESSKGRDKSRLYTGSNEGALPESENKTVVSTNNPSVTLGDVGHVWPELLERVKAIKMSCGTYLSESEPVEVTDGFVVFGFPAEFKFHKEALEVQSNKEIIRSTLVSLLGRETGVSFVITEAVKVVVTKPLEQVPSAKDHDIITSALNIFDGSKVIHRDP